jgi:hypothetical protein
MGYSQATPYKIIRGKEIDVERIKPKRGDRHHPISEWLLSPFSAKINTFLSSFV